MLETVFIILCLEIQSKESGKHWWEMGRERKCDGKKRERERRERERDEER